MELLPDTSIFVENREHAQALFAEATHNRRTVATRNNPFGSSRSHAVFQFRLYPGADATTLQGEPGEEREARRARSEAIEEQAR